MCAFHSLRWVHTARLFSPSIPRVRWVGGADASPCHEGDYHDSLFPPLALTKSKILNTAHTHQAPPSSTGYTSSATLKINVRIFLET